MAPLPAPPSGHPDQPITFTATASDPDQDPLTFALVNPPAGAVIDNQGNFSWTPTWAQLGARTITVRATDPGGLSGTASCTRRSITRTQIPPAISITFTTGPAKCGFAAPFPTASASADTTVV